MDQAAAGRGTSFVISVHAFLSSSGKKFHRLRFLILIKLVSTSKKSSSQRHNDLLFELHPNATPETAAASWNLPTQANSYACRPKR